MPHERRISGVVPIEVPPETFPLRKRILDDHPGMWASLTDELMAAGESRYNSAMDKIREPGLTRQDRREVIDALCDRTDALIGHLDSLASNYRHYFSEWKRDLADGFPTQVTEEDARETLALAVELDQFRTGLTGLMRRLTAHQSPRYSTWQQGRGTRN